MAWRPKKPCGYAGCGRLVDRGYCLAHERQRKADVDARRGSASARGYGARWRAYRLAFIAEHPLCVQCAERGEVSATTDVDHIIPHRGDERLFWDPANHQGLCHPCHSAKTSRADSWNRGRGGSIPTT